MGECVCIYVAYPSVLSALAVQRVKSVHEAGHALLQGVQRVMLGVVARKTVPEASQSLPDQLQLLPLWPEAALHAGVES